MCAQKEGAVPATKMSDAEVLAEVSRAATLRIGKLELSSGDLLVLQPNVKLTEAQRDGIIRWLRQIHRVLPAGCEAILIPQEIDLRIITKAQIQEALTRG